LKIYAANDKAQIALILLSARTGWKQGFARLFRNYAGDRFQAITQLLERAFAAASTLPEPEQDSFAALLLAELDSERRWSEAFAATQDQLSEMAEQALRELEAGQAQPIDLERDFPNH
jgi:hypothetical protein